MDEKKEYLEKVTSGKSYEEKPKFKRGLWRMAMEKMPKSPEKGAALREAAEEELKEDQENAKSPLERLKSLMRSK